MTYRTLLTHVVDDRDRLSRLRMTASVARAPPDREERAHRVAWAAVKRRYRKQGDRWVEL